MKLEHFIKALKHNNVSVESIIQDDEVCGAIKISDYISLTYFQNDGVIQSAQFIYAAIKSYDPNEQLEHVTRVLNLCKLIVNLLCNVDGIEVMRFLGLFDGTTFESKEIIYQGNMFKIDSANGLMLLTMRNEVE